MAKVRDVAPDERTIVLTPGAIVRYEVNSEGCLILHYKEGNEKQLSEYFHLIGKLIDDYS